MIDSPDAKGLHVIVVDDSAVVRQTLSALFTQEGMRVTVASDPIIASAKMAQARPDVMVLDLELPRMHGLTFLRQVMSEGPLPIVVCSAVTGDGTEAGLRALEEGAVAIVTKPKLRIREFLYESGVLLVDAVRAAALARLRKPPAAAVAPSRVSADAVLPPPRCSPIRTATDRVVAIGASTGGTEALREILQALPPDAPGIIVVQHMPEGFTAAFADRLDSLCGLEVKEAKDGDRMRQGRVLIAPGNRHILLRRNGAHYVAAISDGPLVSRHRPSVDVLFRSVAQSAGANAIGLLMTGMGDDGAAGMLEMKRAGAATIVQDEATCAVFGMPREAIERGAVDEVVPLEHLPAAILRMAVPASKTQ